MKFYNVRKRASVEICDSKCTKRVAARTLKDGSSRDSYIVSAVDDDGTKLNLFVSKAVFDATNCALA